MSRSTDPRVPGRERETHVYRVPDHITITEVDGGAIAFDARVGGYLQLNATAAIVLTVLRDGGTAGDAVEVVLAGFDTDASTAERDVTACIAGSVARGLLAEVGL